MLSGDSSVPLTINIGGFASRLMKQATAIWEHEEPRPIHQMPRLSKPVENALMHVKDRFGEAMKLDDMAEAAGISRFYLIHKFKKETGYTPHRYLTLLRMKHAKSLLLTRPDLKVGTIGQKVGYKDLAAFVRAFGDCTGQPPTTYRQRGLARAMFDESLSGD